MGVVGVDLVDEVVAPRLVQGGAAAGLRQIARPVAVRFFSPPDLVPDTFSVPGVDLVDRLWLRDWLSVVLPLAFVR